MRRGPSIFLILLFWLGPLAALLPADDDSGLPLCCRRHGAHHCAASAQMAERASDSGQIVTASSHCQLYQGAAFVPSGRTHALAVSAAGRPILFAQPHTPAPTRADALQGQIPIRPGRAPPEPTIA